MKHMKTGGVVMATSLLSIAAAGPAFGGAFALSERSASAQGTSFASATSGGTDVTYAGFNPAALSRVKNLELGGSLSTILVNANGSSTNIFAGGATTEFDPSDWAVVGGGAIGYRLTDDLVAGVTLNTPYGLRTDYPNNAAIFPAGLQGLESNLLTLSLTPILSYNITPELAVAAGPTITYVDAYLSRGIAAPVGGRFPLGTLEGDTVSYSFKVGALWDPLPGTTIGLSYDHKTNVNIENGNFTTRFTAADVSFGASAETTLPAVVGAGIRQKLDDDITIMADVRYFLWSQFDIIDVSIPGADEVTDYRNAVFAAVGIEGQFAPGFKVRTGVAFDQTPTRDSTRSVRIPDDDRFWWSIGASYDLNESMSFDVGYSLLLAQETQVLANGATVFTPVDYDGVVHIISVGGSIKF